MIGWAIAAAITAAAAPQQAEMARVADAFDAAQIAQDAAALDRMVDDGLLFIDGSGKRQGKAEFIAGWTGGNDRFEPVVLVDRSFTPIGENGFVVSAETTLRGTSGGKPFDSRIRFSDTFRRTQGQWRAVHIHVTRIAE